MLWVKTLRDTHAGGVLSGSGEVHSSEKRQDTLKGREQAKPAFNPQPDTLSIVMEWGMPVPSAGLFTVLTRHCLSFFVPLSLPALTLV